MKMQKTDMEFVTFNAQDILTTSGGPFATQALVAQIGAIAEYNKTVGASAQLFNISSATNGIPLTSTGADKSGRWLWYNFGQDDTTASYVQNEAHPELLRNAEAASTEKSDDITSALKTDYFLVGNDTTDAVKLIGDWLKLQRGQ